MQRIVILGNSGSGKTTMALELAQRHGLPYLDLDALAWDSPGERKPLVRSAALIEEFVAAHTDWVAEGCYSSLIELVLPRATEVRFLNPGVDACVANCLARPWEPDKYPSRDAQDAMLEFLIDWVRQYETRDDEYSLSRHRTLFDGFAGPKREFRGIPGEAAAAGEESG